AFTHLELAAVEFDDGVHWRALPLLAVFEGALLMERGATKARADRTNANAITGALRGQYNYVPQNNSIYMAD
ncbi:MAG TPA: hypothetical protein VEV38_09960, partial [Candidatus Eremiobacteraceae bacterium]|nr:hypothetical protein [Candidatus Eremiobacteraceae bacterium]